MEMSKTTNMVNLGRINKFFQRLRGIRKSSIAQWGCWKYFRDGVIISNIMAIMTSFALQLMFIYIPVKPYEELIKMLTGIVVTQIGLLSVVIIRIAVLRKKFKRR